MSISNVNIARKADKALTSSCFSALLEAATVPLPPNIPISLRVPVNIHLPLSSIVAPPKNCILL
jgi:hypothetical protein